MILAIDIGNTNIVLGAYDEQGKLQFLSRSATDKNKTEDQYAIQIKDILALYGIKAGGFSGAILSSVVPPLSGTVGKAIEKLSGKMPLVVGPGIKTGLNIRTDNPAEVGSDLVVESVAAVVKYPYPLVIVDMGTATKISYINADGAFAGCAIMPGVRISLDALSERTAQLPHVSIDAPRKVVGTNTIDSMRSGIVLGSASMIDGMIERIEDENGKVQTVVATGGYAHDIIGNCKRNIVYDPTLLLDGLYYIYKKNTVTTV